MATSIGKQEGLFGLDPLTSATGVNAVAGILGGIGSYLGGGKQRKRNDQLFNLGLNLFNQPGNDFNPAQYGEFAYRGILPELKGYGERLNEQFSLDSGVGQGELANSLVGQKYGLYAQGMLNKQQFNQQDKQNRLAILSLLGNLNRG